MPNKFPVMSVPVTDGLPNVMMMDAASISGGMAFLVGELEKRDEKLHEPLTSITWPRDMPVKTGGGWVDSVSVFDVSYATSGGTNDGLIAGETNDLPMMQADISKDTYRVLQWGHILSVPLIDQQKLQKIGRNLDEILNKGLHLAYDKAIDRSVYTGIAKAGTHGLVNDPNITAVVADPHTSGGTDTRWTGKTPDEILADVNRLLLGTWTASEYDLSGMANHILMPPAQYAYIVKTKVGVTGDKSILQFLLENNIGKNQGVEVVIAPCQYCVGAGTGGADRMVGYCNDVDRVRFDITVPLQRMLTQASARDMAYLTPYVSQFSELQWPYRQHAMYVDGI